MDNAALTRIIRHERTAALIVNTQSRRGERYFLRILRALRQRGIEVVASYPVREPARLREVARASLQHGTRLVVVGGGDGTFSGVVDEFVLKDVALGFVPLGTGNTTVRTLNIPLTLNAAIDAIVDGCVADVDVGKAGDGYFINAIAVGFTAEAVRRTPAWLKRYFGQLAYVLSGIVVFATHRPFACLLRANGREVATRAHEVIIANGRYFGDTVLSGEASIQSGRLVVHTIDQTRLMHLLARLFVFLVLQRPDLPGRHHFNTEQVWLDTDPAQLVDIDGESIVTTPISVSVVPKALKVMLPSCGDRR